MVEDSKVVTGPFCPLITLCWYMVVMLLLLLDSIEVTPEVDDNIDSEEVDIEEVDELVELVVPEAAAISNSRLKLVDAIRS